MKSLIASMQENGFIIWRKNEDGKKSRLSLKGATGGSAEHCLAEPSQSRCMAFSNYFYYDLSYTYYKDPELTKELVAFEKQMVDRAYKIGLLYCKGKHIKRENPYAVVVLIHTYQMVKFKTKTEYFLIRKQAQTTKSF